MERNGIGVQGGMSLGDAIGRNQTLTRLNLSLNDIAPEGGASLARGLRSNTSLTQLTLVRCGLGPGGGRALGEALETNRHLLSLDVEQNDLGVEGGVAFGRALAVNTSLATLGMRSNRIGYGLERATAFAKALEVNSSLTSLNMAQNELGAVGGAAFAAALRRNTGLTSLDLRRNELGPDGGAAIGAAVGANASLTRLDLSDNAIGNGGVSSLADAVAGSGSLADLDVSLNALGGVGGALLAAGVGRSRVLRRLTLDRNGLGAAGGAALAAALLGHEACALVSLSAAGNELGASAPALAAALPSCRALRRLQLPRNDVDDGGGVALCEAFAAHPALRELDLSSNIITALPIETQLRLARRLGSAEGGGVRGSVEGGGSRLDLSVNVLTSPPLAHRAGSQALGDYLAMLSAEPQAVSRIRLMVVGFGGVGKTTFCAAATCPPEVRPTYAASLRHCSQWDAAAVAAWARGLGAQRGTEWASKAAAALSAAAVNGAALPSLLADRDGALAPAAEGLGALGADGGAGHAAVLPSARLGELCRTAGLGEREVRQLALAVGSLLRKGYFSTVGAVKVDGAISLPRAAVAATADADAAATADAATADADAAATADAAADAADADATAAARECALVDFAGQMEYLVTHQLLLASMHTLCLVIQPLGSFAQPSSRHHGSWRYWLSFLRALGERRTASVILAASQLDRVETELAVAEAAAAAEFDALKEAAGGGLGAGALRLDYRSAAIDATLREVRRRLGEAAEAVSSDWWVPASYERLADVVRALRARKERERSLPIVTREELRSAVEVDGHASLCRLCSDPLLMQRAIDYLEAVGDAMSDRRLDVLLLDPVGWFAAFLAHFVRDDGNPCADVVRGVVALPDIVAALQHGYSAPEAQLNEVMSLVCSLELCVELSRLEKDAAGCGRFLFPCLLPLVSAPELACHWPAAEATATPLAALVMRGHRFRARDRFLPPGVFPMLVARLARLPIGSVNAMRLWRDAAVVRFRAASALLRVDLAAATLDIVVAAPNDAYHFVGAAKGQASAVRWLAHLVRQMLARGYPSITFDEAWLCPTPSCHGVPCGGGDGDEGAPVAGAAADRDFGTYCGTEFPLEPTAAKPGHACEHEGCWNFLGTGHRLEPLQLRAAAAGAEAPAVCASCGQQPYFPLRAGGGFGWAAKEDAELLRGGMSVAQPRAGIGCKVGELHEDVGRDTKRLGS